MRAYSPLKNLFSPHKGRGKKDKEKNRNAIAALLHLSHDKSFGVPGAIRQTTMERGERVDVASHQGRMMSAVEHDSSSGEQKKVLRGSHPEVE